MEGCEDKHNLFSNPVHPPSLLDPARDVIPFVHYTFTVRRMWFKADPALSHLIWSLDIVCFVAISNDCPLRVVTLTRTVPSVLPANRSATPVVATTAPDPIRP